MGGGGKDAKPSPEVTGAETSAINALTALSQQQNKQGQTLFNTSFPGFQQAENFYSTLASGDPYAISRAIAPATQQISNAATAAKKNIMMNAPAGGEKNLALEEVDVNKGAQVGNLASSAYLGSFNALAGLAGQGINQSLGSTGQAISGAEGAGSVAGELGQQQIEYQKMRNEAKGATLGGIGTLGADVASGIGGGLAASAGGAGTLASIGAGLMFI